MSCRPLLLMYSGIEVYPGNDLKWTKHIDHIHAKSNKTIGMIKAACHNILRKSLDKAYSTVVRPTLEYASPLWAGLWAQDADHFESIQYQAGRVITGATKFTPKVKVREELLLDSLAARCDAASLQIMYRMVNENAPAHLQTLKPKMHSEVHGASIRNATSKTLNQPKVWLQSTQNSFLPKTVSLWNKMLKELQINSALVSFKLGYKNRHFVVPDKNIQTIRCIGIKSENTKHARLRMEWSCLHSTLNKIGITDSKNCNNCSKPETTSHYLLQHKRFSQQRQNLPRYIKLSVLNIKVTTDLLLNDSS